MVYISMCFDMHNMWKTLQKVTMPRFFCVVTPCNVVVGYRNFGGSKDLRNFGILSQHYTAWQPEDKWSKIFWNVSILPQNYTASAPRKRRLESSPPCKYL